MWNAIGDANWKLVDGAVQARMRVARLRGSTAPAS